MICCLNVKPLLTATRVLVLFTCLTGFVYPMIVTGLVSVLFPWQANGSFVQKKGIIVGSLRLGQWFDSPYYFSGRPSATVPNPYQANASGGSNWGPTNPKLWDRVRQRAFQLKYANPSDLRIPIDLVTASGSGLDPEISPFAAYYQVKRIAKARNLPEGVVQSLVLRQIQGRTWGLLGEPRVNVLLLNLALDNMGQTANAKTL